MGRPCGRGARTVRSTHSCPDLPRRPGQRPRHERDNDPSGPAALTRTWRLFPVSSWDSAWRPLPRTRLTTWLEPRPARTAVPCRLGVPGRPSRTSHRGAALQRQEPIVPQLRGRTSGIKVPARPLSSLGDGHFPAVSPHGLFPVLHGVSPPLRGRQPCEASPRDLLKPYSPPQGPISRFCKSGARAPAYGLA